ncbi:hypothetical protein HMPREF9439_02634 [Parasutterella excrementihominis YIT 11859]|uniref:Uncharacterized protein n=1 Tax=Parasutterella excrementihominis YIT 11859 TaxID=762966 RepID=F3QNU8_9BURK|nr:hypothetical protein HMPREF9439_02634 [Parasutterella excrementihominis YIT 11859]DAJ98402.1 MAG TPA: hypothetical protein [Caudoviricetes sp.]
MKPLFERMAITKNKFSPHEVSSLKINEPLGNFAHLTCCSKNNLLLVAMGD